MLTLSVVCLLILSITPATGATVSGPQTFWQIKRSTWDGSVLERRGLLPKDYQFEFNSGSLRIKIREQFVYDWQIEVTPPTGKTLQAGKIYVDPTMPPGSGYQSDGTALYTSYDSMGYRGGSFFFKDLRFAPDGSVQRFWLIYSAGIGYGEIRYQAPAVATVANASPIVLLDWESETIPNRGVAFVGGLATDEKEIAGGLLPVRWSQVSGPGIAKFSAATTAYTSVTFSQPGTYVLRLTANDGKATAFDEVTVTQTDEITSVLLRGELGERSLEGNAFLVTPREGKITVSRDLGFLANAIAIDFDRYGPSDVSPLDGFSITLAAPANAPLAPGRYVGAKDFPQIPGPTPWPYLQLSVNGMGRNNLTGSFDVRLVELDGDGRVLKLWATFTNRDRYSQASLSGEIRYRLAPEDLQPAGANQAPAVAIAGADQFLHKATLAGSAADDGWPRGGGLSTRWSRVSGPGEVAFSDAASPTSDVSFSVPGTYVLRLTADDGELQTSLDYTLTVADLQTAVSVPEGTYVGMFESAGGEGPLQGDATLSLTATGSFTASLRLDGVKAAFSGTLSAEGVWVGPVPVGTNRTVAISFAANTRGLLVGTVEEAGKTASLLLDRRMRFLFLEGFTNGRYTLGLLQDLGSTTAPPGHGFGTATVGTYGEVKGVFRLPDGSSGSFGTYLTQSLQAPFRIQLSKGGGQLSGCVQAFYFQDSSAYFQRITLGGKVRWAKPERTKAVPPTPAFATSFQLAASRFRPTQYGKDDYSLPQANARLSLLNPAWAQSLASPIFFAVAKRKARPVLLPGGVGITRLGLNAATGGFEGSFLDPVTQKPGRFSGMFLQDRRAGYGYSRSSDGSVGAVEWRPDP